MTEQPRDDETGRYRAAVSDEDLLAAVAEAGGPASTQMVADAVGLTPQTTRRRLHALADSTADLARLDTGHGFAWYLP